MSSHSDRSAGARDAQIRRDLEPDVGPLPDDEHDCEAGPCDESAVFAVPATEGGEARYCSFHLEWYRRENSETWERLEVAPDRVCSANPNDYAAAGNRFVSLADAPQHLADGDLVRVALLNDGRVLYESAEPEDGVVEYVAISASLDVDAATSVAVRKAGEWLRANFQKFRWLDVEDDVARALTPAYTEPSQGDSP
ncbi:hypothetical protein [Halobaculum marinum]|uniref:Uncharacterized protein n=1 Tax=Halobaculum marinum TaxID=3031996 RepID=A0ABD5WXT8_9EURY|nr:hypothetical protein [Halobaculum sp. DT55]